MSIFYKFPWGSCSQMTMPKLANIRDIPFSSDPYTTVMSLIWVQVTIKARKEKEMTKGEKGDRNSTNEQTWRQGGCLSWMRTRQRDKHKTGKKNFLPHLKGCWKVTEKMANGDSLCISGIFLQVLVGFVFVLRNLRAIMERDLWPGEKG